MTFVDRTWKRLLQGSTAGPSQKRFFVQRMNLDRRPGRTARLLVALAGCAWLGTGAVQAQTSSPQKPQPIQEPLDINSIRPPKINPPAGASDQLPAQPDAQSDTAASPPGAIQPDAAATAGMVPASSTHAGQAGEIDGNVYPVNRFVLEWAVPNEGHPVLDELMETEVTLGVTPTGYVSPYELAQNRPGEVSIVTDTQGAAKPRSGVTLVTKKIKDLADGGTKFYASAIREVSQLIANAMLARNIIIVFAHPSFDQIANEDAEGDILKGDDLRADKQGDLRMVINTGRIASIRSLASGDRLDSAILDKELTRINPADPIHQRIRDQSPVAPGDLVRRDVIDDYLFRLNRHPGRRVDVAFGPSTEPGDVSMDYTITENKPWVAYFQLSNTGTEATNVWRQRFGFVHNQLTKNDDTLRIDYITGGFKEAHAVNIDYTFPLISDQLKARVYGGYSQYNAADVGFAGDDFEGKNHSLGAEVVYNIFQHKYLFLDGTAGVRWQDTEVNSAGSGGSGKDNFFTPYVGLNLEQFTDDTALTAGITFTLNADELDPAERDDLGRQEVDGHYSVIRFSAERSRYLEPIFNNLGWFTDGKPFQSLAQEVAVSLRGQWSLDHRLIPTEQDVAGGMFSVRGYPESIAAGDDVIIASMEYRYHVPNGFPISEPGYIGSGRGDRKKMPEWFGSDFRWAPQQPFSRADWDLVLKAFLDMGSTSPTDQLVGEYSDTLVGTGIGAELVYRRNVSFRLDWGVALHHAGATDSGTGEREVESGDNELHFQMTISY